MRAQKTIYSEKVEKTAQIIHKKNWRNVSRQTEYGVHGVNARKQALLLSATGRAYRACAARGELTISEVSLR